MGKFSNYWKPKRGGRTAWLISGTSPPARNGRAGDASERSSNGSTFIEIKEI